MRVTGWLDRDDVQREIEKARCLVFPSLWPETYGLVVTEAAALGIPSIVARTTAASERIEDGVTGWLWQTGDLADLENCLMTTKDNETIRSIGRACYDSYWKAPPTRTAHMQKLMALYSQILDSKRAQYPRKKVRQFTSVFDA